MEQVDSQLINQEKEQARCTIKVLQDEESECGYVLYRAEFDELENGIVNYKTLGFLSLCIFLTLFYGIGIILFPYVFILRYIARQEFRRRRLYITTENVVMKTNSPACFPCLGDNKSEKHVLLPLVTDVVIEQGFMEAWFGLHSVKIENAGQGDINGAHSVDLRMQGITNPQLFKKILLRAATVKRNGLAFTQDDVRGIITNSNPLPLSQADAPILMDQITASRLHIAAATHGGEPSQKNWDQLNTTMSRIEQLLTLQMKQQEQYLQLSSNRTN